MIEPDSSGGFRFRGTLYRDGSRALAVLEQLDERTRDCLREAFDRIEAGDETIFPFIYPNWYIARHCGHWINIGVEPGESWADVLDLVRAT